MDIKTALLGAGVIGTGLMSGLLYGWAVSVIPGTRRTPDANYVETMQHINKAIINPAFILPYMGIPLVLGGAAIAQYRVGEHRRAWLLVGATATYVVGVLGVTVGGNVPLNDALEAFNLSESGSDAVSKRRVSYEAPWNRWHFVRTAASVASFSLAAAAAIASSEG